MEEADSGGGKHPLGSRWHWNAPQGESAGAQRVRDAGGSGLQPDHRLDRARGGLVVQRAALSEEAVWGALGQHLKDSVEGEGAKGAGQMEFQDYLGGIREAVSSQLRKPLRHSHQVPHQHLENLRQMPMDLAAEHFEVRQEESLRSASLWGGPGEEPQGSDGQTEDCLGWYSQDPLRHLRWFLPPEGEDPSCLVSLHQLCRYQNRGGLEEVSALLLEWPLPVNHRRQNADLQAASRTWIAAVGF